MVQSKQVKVLLSLSAVFGSLVLIAEGTLPTRITTDERYVLPDINFLLDNYSLMQAKYFSGVAYQFQTVSLLRLSGLDSEALQILSPFIAGLVFAVFFSVAFLIYRREVPSPWWGFALPAVALTVFPGHIVRMWESTHKGYTFTFVVMILYLLYRATQQDRGVREIGLISLFLVGILLLNYIWGVVYAGLAVAVAVVLHRRRAQTVTATSLAGLLAVVTPGVSDIHRYHRTYFNAVQSQIGRITSALRSEPDDSSSGTPSAETPHPDSEPSGGETTTPEATSTPTPSDSPPEPNASQVGPRFAADPGETVSGLERIQLWDSLEVAGITVSAWYLYSLGIGIVAALTAFVGAVSVWLLARRRLDETGKVVLAVLAYHAVMFGAFFALGDIATLKRIIVVPGYFGVLYFAVLVARGSVGRFVPARSRRVGLAVLLAVLVVTAGLGTNRIPTGGDKPTDIYIEEPDTRQAEWILEHGVSDDCFVVKQELVAHYYQRQSQLRRGSGISHSGIDPIRVNSVYQSRQNDGTAFVCR